MIDPRVIDLPWRTGRKCAYNMYAQRSDDPTDDDIPVLMGDPTLVAHLVFLHNDWLAAHDDEVRG